jgi:hypothetical protein
MSMTERSDFYVYVLFREDGRPFYVGKGRDGRWLSHEKHAREGAKGPRFEIIRRIQRAHTDVPKVKLHEGLTTELALQYEIALIAAIGRKPHGPLVNLTAGGDGLVDPTPEAREALRRHATARFSGKPQSAEHIAARIAPLTNRKQPIDVVNARIERQRGRRNPALSVAKRGKPLSPLALARAAIKTSARNKSPEMRAAVSAAKLGKPRPAHVIAALRLANIGRKLTPEHIAKRSAALIGRKRPDHAQAMRAHHAARRAALTDEQGAEKAERKRLRAIERKHRWRARQIAARLAA